MHRTAERGKTCARTQTVKRILKPTISSYCTPAILTREAGSGSFVLLNSIQQAQWNRTKVNLKIKFNYEQYVKNRNFHNGPGDAAAMVANLFSDYTPKKTPGRHPAPCGRAGRQYGKFHSRLPKQVFKNVRRKKTVPSPEVPMSATSVKYPEWVPIFIGKTWALSCENNIGYSNTRQPCRNFHMKRRWPVELFLRTMGLRVACDMASWCQLANQPRNGFCLLGFFIAVSDQEKFGHKRELYWIWYAECELDWDDSRKGADFSFMSKQSNFQVYRIGLNDEAKKFAWI